MEEFTVRRIPKWLFIIVIALIFILVGSGIFWLIKGNAILLDRALSDQKWDQVVAIVEKHPDLDSEGILLHYGQARLSYEDDDYARAVDNLNAISEENLLSAGQLRDPILDFKELVFSETYSKALNIVQHTSDDYLALELLTALGDYRYAKELKATIEIWERFEGKYKTMPSFEVLNILSQYDALPASYLTNGTEESEITNRCIVIVEMAYKLALREESDRRVELIGMVGNSGVSISIPTYLSEGNPDKAYESFVELVAQIERFKSELDFNEPCMTASFVTDINRYVELLDMTVEGYQVFFSVLSSGEDDIEVLYAYYEPAALCMVAAYDISIAMLEDELELQKSLE